MYIYIYMCVYIYVCVIIIFVMYAFPFAILYLKRGSIPSVPRSSVPPFRPFAARDLLRQCHPNLLQGGW